MKTRYFVAGLLGLGLLAGCNNQPQPYIIDRFFPLNADCSGNSSAGMTFIYEPNGYLDVAAGRAQYFVGLTVAPSDPTAKHAVPALVSNGMILESENRNEPVVTQFVVTYKSSARLTGTPLQPFVIPYTYPADSNATVLLQLISPQLAEQLDDQGAITTEAARGELQNAVLIELEIEARGRYTADGAPFTVGKKYFPITVYRSPPADCDAALGFQQRRLNSVCSYNGQSGLFAVPFSKDCCQPSVDPTCL